MPMAAPLQTLSTAPYHGYQVLFSPFSPKLAFTGAQNYGIAGSGVLIVFEEGVAGFREVIRFPWRDGIFDVTWSEVSEPVLVAAGADGGVVIFDQTVPQGPVAVLTGHTAEVSTVEWSIGRQEQLVLSASWDTSIRLWDPQAQTCLSIFSGHSGIAYEAVWAPHLPHTFASVSADGSLRLWDSAHPPHSTACVRVGAGGEVLTCDWSKYDQHTLFTAGVDATIRGWDIRQLSQPFLSLIGHTQSVRRVKCDHFHGNMIASCSYDFTVRMWDISQPVSPLIETITHHHEFTYGLSFSSLIPGRVADCSWDATVKIYSPPSLTSQPSKVTI